MSSPKPSDLPYQKLREVRAPSPLELSLREVEECMTDFLGDHWRDQITPSDAVHLTDVTLANIVEGEPDVAYLQGWP